MRLFQLVRNLLASLMFALGPIAGAGELYVGANYHPHDSDPATWTRDIQLMQEAGFRVVRLGHLAWDSYEPSEGQFRFDWFDDVMDRLHAAGIEVIIDIAVRPAPIWLHKMHPSVSVVDVNGNIQYPNHRYMEDVGLPDFRKYALRFTDALVQRYRAHPALLAFGIDNEPGDGRISYSDGVKSRYIAWLREKHGSVENLNRAWAGQRWSRRIGDFDEVGFPVSGDVSGAPERILDFRRFLSDEIGDFFSQVLDRVNILAPGALTTTNMWYYSPRKYFDYAPIAYAGNLTRGGCGFYPGVSHRNSLDNALFGIARIQYENTTPFWCTEFVAATAAPGMMRKSAFASLMLGNQLVCVWTWQSMHAGEEQYLQGLIDWDGRPSRKYHEYAKIAADFRKIERYGFPYQPQAEVALAFSFPSQIASASFPELHDGQVQTAFGCFGKRNMDVRVVDLTRSDLPYKLLVLPGMALMDEPSASKVRSFVHSGGTVVMTGYSSMVDEHGQVFATPLPGRLNDVFGIRVSGFEESAWMNEVSTIGLDGERLRVAYQGREIDCESPRFDVIETKGAEVLGGIVGLDAVYPVVTEHRYGAGSAIYVGLPAREGLLQAVLDDLCVRLPLKKGPDVPDGVMARQIDPNHLLYVNLNGTPTHVKVRGASRSILRDRDYNDGFVLEPYDADFIEIP